ncbi:glycosyltransferase [uncultured Megasphaera sp.]|uniref:glycosyltransferase n=1 Tax=uncultured Megasphaera sp. TaxID=165188 RepID=UPI0025E19C84|nr:glycosyltransferase [uncultured Megasphaera sp.]
MEQEKLLSVIVPVYKVEPYLRRCIDSIRCQTYKNLQIILVDDGSPDGCGAICDEYTCQDERVIAVHQANEGLSGARNNGLLFAKGDYIAFVDSDDWLHPEMYETLVRMIEAHQLDMARCSVIGSDGEKEDPILPRDKTPANKVITGADVFELYFTEFLCKVVWNAVYRRDIVMGIVSPERCHSQDNYVSGRYLYRSRRMMITDKCLYYYYKNPTSTTHGGHKRFLDICICTEMLRDDLMREEKMTNASYIDRLNRKLAREFFHFVRADDDRYRLQAMEKSQKKFIETHLDFIRRLRFDWLLHKKHIRIYE